MKYRTKVMPTKTRNELVNERAKGNKFYEYERLKKHSTPIRQYEDGVKRLARSLNL